MENQEHMQEHKADAGEMQKRDWLLPASIVIAAVMVGGALVFSVLYRPSPAGNSGGAPVPSAGSGSNTGPTAQQVMSALQLTSRDVVLGNANAPVTVVEYGDYQCPFCTRYLTQVQIPLVKNYVNAGKAKFVFRNFPFLDRFPGLPAGSNESHDAAVAAECAKDQSQFWPYHDALYQAKLNDETNGGGENDGLFTRSLFVTIANRTGMNISTFTSCMVNGKYASMINGDTAAAQNAGVDSTPTTFVNGALVADQSGHSVGADAQSIFAAIDKALKG